MVNPSQITCAMAVSSSRRKRLTAIILTFCLITTLFLYKKELYETWSGTEVRDNGKGEFSKLDWSNKPTKRTTTALLPTKIYQVVQFEGDGEDVEDTGKAGDQSEGNGLDKIKSANGEEEMTKAGKMEDGNERRNIGMDDMTEMELKKKEDGVERKSKESEKNEKGSEDEKNDLNEKKLDRIETEYPRTIIESGKRDEPEKVEESLDEIQNTSHLETSKERKADTKDVDNSREKSKEYTVAAGHVKSTAKPVRSPSLSRSVQNALPSNSSIENLRVTSTPSSSRITGNRETITTKKDARTTKASWPTKTTKMNNPRFKKSTQPVAPPTAGQNKGPLSPSTTNVPTDEPLKCKIPSLDPFHPHVSRLQNNVGTNLRKICRGMYPYIPVFKIVGNRLVLKKNVEEKRIVKKSVELREIKREYDSHFSYRHRNPFKSLTSLRESNDIGQFDFFRLDYKIDGRRASDLYARVSPRHDILKKQTKLAEQLQKKALPLNVLIIGFDSTSRANFVRKLPRVKLFLETELNTYFMDGMSIVGDATTPVLIAMLTGKDETVLPEGRKSYGGNPIDNWPWIMKDYERQGYMTLYAEDDPSVSAFNLRLRGFSRSPTHHYMRPFWLSLEREHERDEPGRCSKSESMVNHTLKYVKSFFDAYPTSRKFAFAFHSYLAHAHPNHLSFAEDDLMWFLKTFVDKGYLKDTMLIIMGDHGSRNSEYRDTIQGKLEERLPWFSISLPSEFHRKFPNLAANLRSNQAVITSSFDVHATLRHILTYPRLPRGEQTQSLFEKLPRKRSCEDAGIAEHWCPCFQWSPTDINSKHAHSIAVSAVKFINEKLLKDPMLDRSCHKLSLDRVIDAVTLRANDKVQTFYSTDQDGDRSINYAERTQDLLRYQIIFTTQPNNAKYEVTASVSPIRDQVTLNPEISRLNRYNNQPACIAQQYPYARKFCYCRTSA